MSLWTSNFQNTIDDIVVLYRNATGRDNPSFREKQLMDRAVNEALQEISLFKYGQRVRFLEVNHEVATVSGTDTYSIKDSTTTSDTAELVSIISGTVTLLDDDAVLSEISREEMAQLRDADSSGTTGEPAYYAVTRDATNGADYLSIILYPVPDAVYTVGLRATKVISEDGVTEIPSVLQGALLDIATATAMRRIGFGNPSLYQGMAERTLANFSAVIDSDGPLHIPRGNMRYRSAGLQSRKN